MGKQIFAAGQALSNLLVSGSTGAASNATYYDFLSTDHDPRAIEATAIYWSGVGTLTLKDSNGVAFYTKAQASAGTAPLPILASTGGTSLVLTTPITYNIVGATKGTIAIYGKFI